MQTVFRKYTLIIHFVLFSIWPCFAFTQYKNEKHKLDISLSAGYQQQNLTWSIAGNLQGQNPNILSELKWKNVGGPVFDATATWNVWKLFFVHTSIAQSITVTGSVNDTDYQGDDRTDPSFNETLKSNHGNSTAILLLAGYKIMQTEKCNITPYIGYGIKRQSFFLLDDGTGAQKLNSNYKPVWNGLAASLEIEAILHDRLRLKNFLSYHQVNYRAKADWNLIDDFQHPLSFKHIAKGYAVDANVQLHCKLRSSMAVFFGAKYFYGSTGEGIDELYKTSGQIIKTQLNDVSTKGFALGVGLNFYF